MVEHPELYPYFYENEPVPIDVDEKTRIQVEIISEMLADMIDHAAASLLTHEGWEEYANDMYEHSPAFRRFADERRQWYPSMWRWIER